MLALKNGSARVDLAVHALDGYCDRTEADSHVDCELDDKGNFPLRWQAFTTWESAFSSCRSACLACKRCNYISVSLRWADCSWFHSCSSWPHLHDEVNGFRSAVMHRHAALRSQTTTPDQFRPLWTQLRQLERTDQRASAGRLNAARLRARNARTWWSASRHSMRRSHHRPHAMASITTAGRQRSTSFTVWCCRTCRALKSRRRPGARSTYRRAARMTVTASSFRSSRRC